MQRLLIAAAIAFGLAMTPPTGAAKDWTRVTVGIEGAFPPWNMFDASGNLSSFDVDLIKDLCVRAKVECVLQSGVWSSLIPGLNAGKFDLIMTLGINEKRKQAVDFSAPYASGAATFIILKNGAAPPLPETGERLDLNDKSAAEPVMAEIGKLMRGKTIGVVQSTSQEQLIHAYFGETVTVRAYPSSGERDLDLKAGRIDAAFGSGVYGMAMLAKPGNEDLQMTGPLMKGAMLATEVALGMRKDEPDLKEKFDAAIKSAAQAGVIRSLSRKWSKLDLTPSFKAN